MLRQFFIGLAALSLCACVLTGCGRSPRVNFYTLGAAVKSSTVNPSIQAPSVSVVNITLPALVDRPQLVERVSGNRVEILESQRWAEPLKNAISRLLAESLANRLGSDLVTAYPQNGAGNPDFRVYVDIQRFESMGDSVSVDAHWSIRRRASEVPIKTGHSQVHETSGAEGYEALVAAYNRAIVSVGNDIAQAIRSEWSAGR
jgi:uncharacterized lipoprotein YmbA